MYRHPVGVDLPFVHGYGVAKRKFRSGRGKLVLADQLILITPMPSENCGRRHIAADERRPLGERISLVQRSCPDWGAALASARPTS